MNCNRLLVCLCAVSIYLLPCGAQDKTESPFRGTVADAAQEFDKAAFKKLSAAKDAKAWQKELMELLSSKPASEIVVRLRSDDGKTYKTKTDKAGKFWFPATVPNGYYNVDFGKPFAITKQTMISTDPRIELLGLDAASYHFQLYEKSAMLTLRGRVVDAAGKALPGVTVTGTRQTHSDFYYVPYVATTDKKGYYEFENIPPPGVWIVAGWLTGGNPFAGHPAPFYFLIELKKPLTGQSHQVPLVGENMLKQAHLLRTAMVEMAQQQGNDKIKKEEAPRDSIPAARGNKITVPDIIVNPLDVQK